MADSPKLVREKLDQAVAILKELDIDAWMTFVRETSLSPDPSLDLILGFDMVWQSAFIVTRDNQRIAIIGHHDQENIKALGCYSTIIPYVQGIREDLVGTLMDLNPQKLALNYSENDVAADGLAHGLMLTLERYLADTDFSTRFTSAEGIMSALRGRKSSTEVKRIKAAIKSTQGIFKEIGGSITNGVNEVEIAEHAHKLLGDQGLDSAWDYDYCPTVNIGPEAPVGHRGPQKKYRVQPGMLIHMDFGAKHEDYCADLQRVWYALKPGESKAPEPVQKGFKAAQRALMAGFKALRPGTEGWQVDEAARSTLVESGYPEYQHAFGHHLGRAAHDGATVLGPRWERYGRTPFGIVEVGNVFAIELGVAVEGYGYIGLEENVVITESGADWLSEPQREVWLVGQ
jgi:Xaa-Pro aminopeptidase